MTKEEVGALQVGTRIQIASEADSDDVSELKPYWGQVVTVRKVEMRHDRPRVYFSEHIGPSGYFYPEEILYVVDAPVEEIEEEYEPADIQLLFGMGGVVFES